MTDDRLTQMLADVLVIERDARTAWEAARDREDLAEHDPAVVVMRQATALRKSLESWVSRRALRAQLVSKS